MSDEVKKNLDEPVDDFEIVGVTGLERTSGMVQEEFLRQLDGTKRNKVFREMMDNDAVIGAFLYAIETLVGGVQWPVKPFSEETDDLVNAQFVEECLKDMEQPWEEYVSEILSMLGFGFAPLELVYKVRGGPATVDPKMRSNYSDGRIGWRMFGIRAQESLDHWEFDVDGNVLAMYQDDPNGEKGSIICIPMEKLLLFRTTSRKNNPEGKSVLRNAYVSWFRKKELERIESIGHERNLAGVPYLRVPAALMSSTADAATRAKFESYKKIVRNLRQDQQAGVILPGDKDDKGNELYSLQLLSASGGKTSDIDVTIKRYERAIAGSVLADFLLLGHQGTGSYALSSDKTSLFTASLGRVLKSITTVVNRVAIPRLFELNGLPLDRLPQLTHGDIEKQEVDRVAQAFAQIAAVAGITPQGPKDENWFRRLLGMPEVPET